MTCRIFSKTLEKERLFRVAELEGFEAGSLRTQHASHDLQSVRSCWETTRATTTLISAWLRTQWLDVQTTSSSAWSQTYSLWHTGGVRRQDGL